jgi:hypothetical protein
MDGEPGDREAVRGRQTVSMSAWDAVGAIAESVSALGIGAVVWQISETRKSRGLAEVVAYNDTKAHLDARAPRVGGCIDGA